MVQLGRIGSTMVWFLAWTLTGGISQVQGARSRFGLLVAVTPGLPDQHFCIRYYPELHNLTSNIQDAPQYELKDLTDLSWEDTCPEIRTSDPRADLPDLTQKVALVSAQNASGNCSIADRAHILETHHAVGLIADDSVPTRFNASEHTTNIFVTALFHPDTKQKLLDIKQSHPKSKFIVYGPEEAERTLDGSLILIFCMAVFTVGLGSLWSGYTKHSLRLTHERKLPNSSADGARYAEDGSAPGDGAHVPDPQAANQDHNEAMSVSITPIWVIFFVFGMCSMLILLYFFFNYLVYIVIGMFVLASIIATYACFEPMIMWSYHAFPCCPTLRIPRCNLYLCVINMELRQFMLLCVSVGLSLVWLVFRKEDWAWILQDFLGIMFSLNMLKTLRLPSFKICTILLSILFFYDIFFVFITPLFTKNGKSVMVEVATGADTGEQLPMVLRVPRLTYNPLHACWIPYSILGFGDILVPGLLVSYCHAFDLLRETPCKIYWVVSNVFYALSLIATFISLLLMESAQPALLYIVPFTLIPMATVAGVRGEFKEFWLGDKFFDEDGDLDESVHDCPPTMATDPELSDPPAVRSTSGSSLAKIKTKPKEEDVHRLID
ncbi:signal peptide peptidase-like 2B [Tigriopus californicus]|uniref:signal peptide peptidase-like 2B n=1 Tax=Tigriopus californicus TaxID=6832 RepID=UPI0027DA68FF|nr:signal peptide peptidase-like 2B [Tigriopus californicus]